MARQFGALERFLDMPFRRFVLFNKAAQNLTEAENKREGEEDAVQTTPN